MINFISASEDNYEDLIYNELGLDRNNPNSLNEFMNKDVISIIDTIKSTSNTKRIDEYIQDKLILIISIIFKQRNFIYDDNNKKLLTNIFDLIDHTSHNNYSQLIKVYYILPENSSFKLSLLKHLFNKISDVKPYIESIKEMIQDLEKRRNNFTDENLADVFCLYGKIIVNNKLYNLLTINDNHVFSKIIESKNITNDVIKIYFYNMFNVFSFDSYRYDLSKLIEKMDDSFTNEKIILESIVKKNFSYMKNVDLVAIDDIYGRNEVILRNARLRILFSLFENITSNEVKLNELESKYEISIDDLELLMYEGQNNDLFSIIIDYENEIVRVRYVRKMDYTKENINIMKEKIQNLRSKISTIIGKIDNLTV